jgi:hypothetical protein
MNDSVIHERYGPDGEYKAVYGGSALAQQSVHQELLFNAWKLEGLLNLMVPARRELARLRAGYKSDKAQYIDSLMSAGNKMPKTRAEILADIHFRDAILRIEELEGEIELYRLALATRRDIAGGFRTIASDIRSFDG